MKNVNKIYKILIPTISTTILAIILLLIFCLPSKNHSNNLTITAEDISLTVNEEKRVEYTVSNSYAIVSLEISKYETLISLNGFNIKGLNPGTTNLNIIAKYNREIVSKKIKITITKSSNTDNENNIPENENTPKPDDNTNPENNNPDNNNNNHNLPEQPEETIDFSLTNQENCNISGKEITLSKNQLGIFKINNITKDYSITSTEGISINKSIGFSSWEITATKNGKLNIIIDNKVVGEIIIKVI